MGKHEMGKFVNPDPNWIALRMHMEEYKRRKNSLRQRKAIKEEQPRNGE